MPADIPASFRIRTARSAERLSEIHSVTPGSVRLLPAEVSEWLPDPEAFAALGTSAHCVGLEDGRKHCGLLSSTPRSGGGGGVAKRRRRGGRRRPEGAPQGPASAPFLQPPEQGRRRSSPSPPSGSAGASGFGCSHPVTSRHRPPLPHFTGDREHGIRDRRFLSLTKWGRGGTRSVTVRGLPPRDARLHGPGCSNTCCNLVRPMFQCPLRTASAIGDSSPSRSGGRGGTRSVTVRGLPPRDARLHGPGCSNSCCNFVRPMFQCPLHQGASP